MQTGARIEACDSEWVMACFHMLLYHLQACNILTLHASSFFTYKMGIITLLISLNCHES